MTDAFCPPSQGQACCQCFQRLTECQELQIRHVVVIAATAAAAVVFVFVVVVDDDDDDDDDIVV